jgi:hypothetical protein
MKILINALSIQDSGGITVLDKVLNESVSAVKNEYLVICNMNKNTKLLEKRFVNNNIEFIFLDRQNIIYRIFYESFLFPRVIEKYEIDLVYNFSASYQPFLPLPQLIKVHNLLFYSKKSDTLYFQRRKYFLWFKQVYLKRLFFRSMLKKSKYIEIQSSHVKDYLSDYINIQDKIFFVKSDIDVSLEEFEEPKRYDFKNQIKFLYIVGPHFEYLHKNFQDFTRGMLAFEKLGIDFQINITLTQKQLDNSDLWDSTLNKYTNFLGYINDRERFNELFANNTILISTSVIETLGLHVVEAIKSGVVTIVPAEKYSFSVYGKNILNYELFDTESLLNTILSIINEKIDVKTYIKTLQSDLRSNENKKYKSVVDLFEKVVDVQK